jgi:hypothetical protein
VHKVPPAAAEVSIIASYLNHKSASVTACFVLSKTQKVSPNRISDRNQQRKKNCRSGASNSKNLLYRFSKSTQISNFIKIRPVIAELFHANGQIDTPTDGWAEATKAIIALRNFANAVKNQNQEKAASL